ncbi:MAG TPA: CBS domain-containing protein [Nitrososphaeraceae archaeon]|nr:CBS domain-containing protein [Nitrososphaeraceae archaeon]
MASSPDNIRNIAVSEFMTKKVKTITENETMRQACKLMYQDNIGSIVILKKDTNDQDGTTTKKEIAIGMVTERDIARMVGFSAKFFADMPVSEVMSKPLITVNPDTSVKDAVSLMEQKDIRRLPVIDDKGQIVGIITAKDIFKAIMKTFKETRKDKDLMFEGYDLLGLLGAE